MTPQTGHFRPNPEGRGLNSFQTEPRSGDTVAILIAKDRGRSLARQRQERKLRSG